MYKKSYYPALQQKAGFADIAAVTLAFRRFALVVSLVVTGVVSVDASAECTTDNIPATDSLQSVEQVFDEVSRRWGQIIRADLTAQGIGNLCIWVYEIKLLSSTGEVTNVVYDASRLRMIGFNSPQVAAEEPDVGVLRSIGQRFGFFGRRDPSSEGRADSDRGDRDGRGTASTADGDDGEPATDSDSDSDTDIADSSSSSSGSSNSSGSGGNSGG